MHYNFNNIDQIVSLFLKTENMKKFSVTDIGCFNRPVYDFVSKFTKNIDFIGVDEDEEAIKFLKEKKLKGLNWNDYKSEKIKDYTFAKEVIEHIKEEETLAFLKVIKLKTKKAFFLTTPNFEGWDTDGFSKLSIGRRKDEFKEMRYIPDHLPYFNSSSSNPHMHKQLMTFDNLNKVLKSTFNDPSWKVMIFKAWPWKLNDLSRDTTFIHYFKLHAVVWNENMYVKNMENLIYELCAKFRHYK